MTPSFPVLGTAHAIVLDGADARRFAQAQFSGDVDALQPGRWQWNAWLTAQGRISALMHLADLGDGRLLAVLRGGDADAIRQGLARYLFRLRVDVSLQTVTACAGGPVPAGTVEQKPDVLVLGHGMRSLRLATHQESPPDVEARDCWRLVDIRQGWPTLPLGDPEFLPPALDLERLGAVAFDKGCYPGQEIAARLHYRGGHKWRLARLRGGAPLPLGKTPDESSASPAWVLDAVGADGQIEALAVVHVDASSKINLLKHIYDVESGFDA